MPNARVTVYDSVIRSHFTGGGVVKREVDRVGTRGNRLAKVYAPARTGRLRRSIGVALNGAPGRYGASFTVFANVGYAIFVEEGTTGPILPKRGLWLRLPRSSFGAVPAARTVVARRQAGNPEFLFKQSVSGQAAQHFLKRGVRDALRESGYGTFF